MRRLSESLVDFAGREFASLPRHLLKHDTLGGPHPSSQSQSRNRPPHLPCPETAASLVRLFRLCCLRIARLAFRGKPMWKYREGTWASMYLGGTRAAWTASPRACWGGTVWHERTGRPNHAPLAFAMSELRNWVSTAPSQVSSSSGDYLPNGQSTTPLDHLSATASAPPPRLETMAIPPRSTWPPTELFSWGVKNLEMSAQRLS
ncbi:hypothetical protein B0T25DRAFT_556496 [Lasiosphaeria hispida]|uniref:Uncharacterized protein n=1 Tax=Lasiosphaeria hispida TaxID=260671 RepID=A0AAJ0H9F5_9PEZI|nr:hypothetical protein B0T25DRAFT_556496 [Lasiosphaeria hispida]